MKRLWAALSGAAAWSLGAAAQDLARLSARVHPDRLQKSGHTAEAECYPQHPNGTPQQPRSGQPWSPEVHVPRALLQRLAQRLDDQPEASDARGSDSQKTRDQDLTDLRRILREQSPRVHLGDAEGLTVAGLIATLRSLPYPDVNDDVSVFVDGEPVLGVSTSYHWVRSAADLQVYLHTEADRPQDTPMYNAAAAQEAAQQAAQQAAQTSSPQDPS